MCGRYVSVQKIETIEKRFKLDRTPDNLPYKPSFNVGPGKQAPVITIQKPKELQLYTFGLTPYWAKKKMYMINARAEGKNNEENNPDYIGAKGIVDMPSFRKPIRNQRCLVIADAFYEGPEKEKLSKPYLVFLEEKLRPFAFAGIWDIWRDEAGLEFYSFAIITTVANQITQKIGHHRSPVILEPEQESAWLDIGLPLGEVTSLLHPYDASFMNAYPVGTDIKNPRNDGRQLIEPIGGSFKDGIGFGII